jgi:hypothetical protein
MDEAFARERAMLELIQKATTVGGRVSTTSRQWPATEAVLDEAAAILPQVSTNLVQLNALRSRYDQASTTAAARIAGATSTAATTTNILGNRTSVGTSTPSRNITVVVNQIRQEVVLDYLTLKSSGNLTTESFKEQKRTEWSRVFYPFGGEL